MDPTEPPESSEEERWRTVQPVPNWRQQTRQGLLGRHPVVGVVIVVVLAGAAALAGIEIPDAATVVIRLDKPFSSFPAVLGHPGFGIVPKAAVERLGPVFKTAPVGSGPFRRVEPAAAGRLSLRRATGHGPEARV